MITPGLQESFLNTIRSQRIPAVFFLVNGFQMKGIIKAFDPYTIIIESDGEQKLVFKHAISTIVPYRSVDLSYQE